MHTEHLIQNKEVHITLFKKDVNICNVTVALCFALCDLYALVSDSKRTDKAN